MTDQISDWPPITADLRADGSLELVVAGMSHHFQDTDETTARHAALEHVRELAVSYARPLRVRTSSAGTSTGSLIVAPDATFWAEDEPSVVWPLSALSTTTATASAPADTDMATSLFEIGAATPTRSPKRPRTPRRRSTATIVVVGAALTVVVTGAIALATAQDSDAPKPAAATATATQTVPAVATTTATRAPAPPQLAVRLGKPARRTATLRITSDGAAQTVRVTITRPGGRPVVRTVVVGADRPVRLTVRLKPGRHRWAVTPAEGDALTGRLRVLAPKPKKKATAPPTVRDAPAPVPPRVAPAPKPKPKPAPKPKPKPAPKPKKPPIGDIPDGPIGD